MCVRVSFYMLREAGRVQMLKKVSPLSFCCFMRCKKKKTTRNGFTINTIDILRIIIIETVNRDRK